MYIRGYKDRNMNATSFSIYINMNMNAYVEAYDVVCRRSPMHG